MQPAWLCVMFLVVVFRSIYHDFGKATHCHITNSLSLCSWYFDVTTSNVSFLRGSNTGERDVKASPLQDVTRLAYTTPKPHGRTDHRLPSRTTEPDPGRCHVNSLLQSVRLKLHDFFFGPMPPHALCGLCGPHSFAWYECNRLLRLGRHKAQLCLPDGL